ncbi:hypothetical protein AC626_25635 [Pseudoalteromonas rubra]|uniref:Uncharacterized protein n=1 Tax=Pseudoalteromonas rubra TaxID=43658 RepID=A0A0L0EL41_9GAMM|nr:hypothetical protein AC626_25635 [Pseudoalteromonas rubra]
MTTSCDDLLFNSPIFNGDIIVVIINLEYDLPLQQATPVNAMMNLTSDTAAVGPLHRRQSFLDSHRPILVTIQNTDNASGRLSLCASNTIPVALPVLVRISVIIILFHLLVA